MSWLLEPLQYAFMRQALLAGILIGLTCSLLGVYVVLRRMAFLGDAVAHTTLPGIVLAYLWQGNLFLGALSAAITTALGIGWLSRRQALHEDTAIGVMLSGMFALGVVLISTTRSYRDFSHMLFGNILGVTPGDLIMLAVVAGIVLTALAIFHKELLLTTVDPLHGQVIGIGVERVRVGLLVLLALAVVTGIQAVGVILTTSLLVTPAAAASLLTRRLPVLLGLSAVVGTTSCVTGLYASYYLSISSGGAIVLTATGWFAVACVIRLWRERRSFPVAT